MRYRIHPKTGDKISEIGLGSSFMFNAGQEAGAKAVRRAFEGGINFYDMAAGSGASFPICGEALKDVRKDVLYQIHFGADYSTGDYAKSYDPDAIRRTLDWQMKTPIPIISTTVSLRRGLPLPCASERADAGDPGSLWKMIM